MKRLSTRLGAAFGVVIVLTLVTLSLALLALLRHDPLSQRLILLQLNAQAGGIELLLHREANLQPTTPEGRTWLRELAHRQGRRLLWIDDRNYIRFDSQGEWQDKPLDEHLQLHRVRPGIRWGEQNEEEGSWFFVLRPLLKGSTHGTLAVGQFVPRRAIWQRFRNTLLGPLLKAGALAMVLSGVLALLISRSIVRPLQALVTATHRLAEGDLGARAPEKMGPEEIRHLARTFNTMAAQMEATREAQRAFLANVAHDLRTPLTSIEGFAQALVDGTAGDEATRHQAATAIFEEAQRLEKLTTSLLELARLEAGALQMERQPVDLRRLIVERMQHFRRRAESQGISLRYQPPAAPIIVEGDALRLSQILDNLLDNALRHTPSGGTITVHLEEEGKEARLTVIDTGEGIPAEALPHLFERFYRADPSRGGTGVGLGLAIVREIVRAHGGRVSVKSHPGQGSRFTVWLPRISPAPH